MQRLPVFLKVRHTLVWLGLIGVAAYLFLTSQPGFAAAAQPADAPQVDGPARPASQDAPAVTEPSGAYALQPLAESSQTDPQTAAGYLGLNPAQGLRMVFAPQGVAVGAAAAGDQPWQLGLQVTGVGRSGGEMPPLTVGSTVVADNRIDYLHAAFSEWYINTPEGLKHGFTLTTPPVGAAAPVLVQMRVDGTLQPSIQRDGQVIEFMTASNAALLRYDGLFVYDANLHQLPARFVATPTGFAIQVDDAGAVYPITVDPLLTSIVTKLPAPGGAAGDEFGFDVNVSQHVAVVGMPGDDARGENAGAAYVYQRAGAGFGAWSQLGELVPLDGAAGDDFGRDVYVTFGVTMTVGAPGDDDKGENAGAAYLFARDFGGPNAWGQMAKLTADDGQAGDGYGAAVATQHNVAVVGAPGADDLGADAGAVYLYEQLDYDDPTTWTFIKKITVPEGAAGDRFGAAVVVSGDIVAVGAPGDDDACPANPSCDSGALYIFERNTGGAEQWGLMAKRTADDASAGAKLGTALNFSDSRIIVGAPGDSELGENAGAAYIFDRNLYGPDLWSQRPKIVAPDGEANDQFGLEVGIGGNIATVGAPFDDDNGTDAGAAYLIYFRISNPQPNLDRAVKILALDGAAGDRFGASVDQRSGEIVVGAPVNADAGAIYFYATPFTMGTLQLVNNVEPNDPDTTWNFAVQGKLTHEDSLVGDGQTTPVLLYPGTYTVTEQVEAGVDLSGFVSTWACTVDGDPGPAGSGTTFSLFVGANSAVRCSFTHRQPGSITIQKETKPGGGTGFNFVDAIAAPNSFTLDDGGAKTFTGLKPGVYEVTEDVGASWRLSGISCIDPDGGSLSSNATAFVDLDAGESVTCTYVNKAKEGISVVLTAAPLLAGVGEPITYTYRIINDSPVNLESVTAVDSRFGPLTLGTATLTPNQEITVTRHYTVAAGDLPGPLVNSVAVTGTTTESEAVADNTSVSVSLVDSPELALTVTALPTKAGVEDTVNFTYTVRNTGSTPLDNVRVVDSRLGEVNLIDTSLQPGESTSGGQTYQVVEEDLPGPLTATVQALGTSPTGIQVESEVTVSVTLIGPDPNPEPEPEDKPTLYLPSIQK